MKKLILGLGLFFLGASSYAQNGLEQIIVEKYYVSNAADQTAANADLSGAGYATGTLPVGSVTYRIYADLLPGYNYQATYGVTGHALVVSTSTQFYNNSAGATSPTWGRLAVRNSTGSTIGLDSYFSVGGAANNAFGILKSEDDVALGGANLITVVAGSILQNADASALPALTTQDGYYYNGLPAPAAASFTPGLVLDVFNDGSVVGNNFTTSNGSVYVAGGTAGPVAGTNRVLIGQFTTDGIFHYELNCQVGGPGGLVQNFVASGPTGAEITLASLSGTLGAPNTPPTVSVTSPSNGATFLVGAVVPFNATAADADGTVDSLQFFVDGVKVGSDLSSPYTFNWTATVGAHVLTAKATDNGGTTVTSSPVNITVGNIIPPTVSISSPSNGTTFFSGAVIAINANAADADGSVDSLEFYVDGSKVGSDLSAPYSFNWTGTIGTHALTAKATDNNGATTTSAPVTIQVFSSSTSYALISSSNKCDGSVFCLPLNAIAPVSNVIGYDIVLNYNKNKVLPTGVVTVANALINPNYTSTANSINNTTGTMLISVFFNASAPPAAAFTGMGQLLCVEFAKTASFGAVDTAAFSIASIQESYFNGVQPKLASNGEFRTYQDTVFSSSLKFWFDNSPVKYNAAVPADYLVTNIYGSNGTCTSLSAASVQPNLSGVFSYNVNNGVAINIQKDIPAATDVQPIVNGFDAFLTRRVLINDATFVPSIYQMIAMDVNTDGVISAGDLSQINQRTVLLIPEFKQAWNYNSSGVSNGQLSKDWLFVDATRLNADPAYLISSTFPANDGIGYSKARVPVVPFCLTVPSFTSNICQTLGSETYQGVLLGDVNGNYASYNTGPNAFRLGDRNQVVFDLSKATVSNGYAVVPVMIYADQAVNALDFSMQFNDSKLTFLSVDGQASGMESLVNYNSEDKTLRFTAYSLMGLNAGQTLVNVRFAINGNNLAEADFSSLSGFLNGENATARLKTSAFDNAVSIYPNPASNVLNVEVTEDATIQLLDAQGREVMVVSHAGVNQKHEINTQNIANGIYMLKVYNEHFVSSSKVIIQK